MNGKKFALAGILIALLAGAAALRAQQAAPQKEHEWLKQFAGEWEYDAEMVVKPGKAPMKSKGSESVRLVGGFWAIAEIKGNAFDMPFTGVLTIGYNPQKKKYVATWIDSMQSQLLHYVGSVDKEGKTLTLLTEGPNPAAPDKLAKFKDTFEIKGKEHKILRSFIQGEDGKWMTFMTANYRRKK